MKKRGRKPLTEKEFRLAHFGLINKISANREDLRKVSVDTGYSTQYIYRILNDPRSGIK